MNTVTTGYADSRTEEERKHDSEQEIEMTTTNSDTVHEILMPNASMDKFEGLDLEPYVAPKKIVRGGEICIGCEG